MPRHGAPSDFSQAAWFAGNVTQKTACFPPVYPAKDALVR